MQNWPLKLASLIGLFCILFIPNAAHAGCGNGRIMIYSGCNMSNTGLSGLFRSSANRQVNLASSDTSSLLQPYSPVETPEVNTVINRQMPKKIVKPQKQKKRIASIDTGSNEPHQLPVYMGDTSLLVFRSKNKQLSKNGPDTQAILMMRCRAGELNVLLDFPGYPMSDTKTAKTISYKTDRGNKRKTGFASSNQMSVIGIWQPEQAKRFAKDIFHGRSVSITAKDSENTRIAAKFALSEQAAHTAGFREACGLS